MTEVFVRAVKPSPVGASLGEPYNDSTCLVINDIVSDIPDIIIVQVIELPSSIHLTCVPFLSVVAVKLKLVVSPELLMLTRAAVNPVLGPLKICPKELTVAMGVLSDGGEYQCAKLPFILQVSAPCVCGHTP